MDNQLSKNQDYQSLFIQIKSQIQQAQLKAAISVNKEMLILYWQIGKTILERQEQQGWGAKILEQLSKDLKKVFPTMQGFSRRNLFYMRKLAECYPDFQIVQPLVAQISWSHNIILLDKFNDKEKRLWYAQKSLQNGWSKRQLIKEIDNNLHERQGKAVSNFTTNLPSPLSEMVQDALKDPYMLDFLSLKEEFLEREMEDEIINHITKFLLELGNGFAFLGRQYNISVGEKDYRIDLLFYNVKLHCYMAVDLKATSFKPEYVGKMNFYLSALDDNLKSDIDQPSIGLILCKSKDATTAKYALRNINTPIGISTFETSNVLPENFKSKLPTIEELERELQEINIKDEEE